VITIRGSIPDISRAEAEVRILDYLPRYLFLMHESFNFCSFFAFSLNVFLMFIGSKKIYSMNVWRYDLQYDYKSTDFKQPKKVLSVKKNSSKEVSLRHKMPELFGYKLGGALESFL
jgi:hypothetical protein